MELQYQLSNGAWINCADRADEFLQAVVARATEIVRFRAENKIEPKKNEPDYAQIVSVDSAIAALTAGYELPHDGNYWYATVRAKPAPQQPVVVELVKCDCGHSVPPISRMSASRGTACPDCYDLMSD